MKNYDTANKTLPDDAPQPLFVSTSEVTFNPIQQKLWPLRANQIEQLRRQFEAHALAHDSAYNPTFPLVVRHASAQEQEQGVKFVCIDGHRRLAVAKELHLPEVPLLVDEGARPEDDAINLKRVVEGDAGYGQVDRAKLLAELIQAGVPQRQIESEYSGDTLRRMLGFIFAPEDLKRIVEHDESKFTRLSRVMAAAFTKPDGELVLQPPTGTTRREAEQLVRYIVLTRQDLNSEKATAYARELRKELIAGNIEINLEGDIVASYPWKELGMNAGAMSDERKIEEEANRALDRLREQGSSPVDSKWNFNEALAWVMEKFEIDERSLADALGVSRPYIAQLLSRVAHPSDSILGLLRLELARRRVPKAIVNQVWLLGFRDAQVLPTKGQDLAANYVFKAGRMLQGFLEAHSLTQADIHRATGIGPATISGFVRDQVQPHQQQQTVIARFLRKRGVPELALDLWRKAVARDRLYLTMLRDDVFPTEIINEAVAALDERFGLGQE
jgi:transcriptional regulator with XRE-family HTH domain